MRLESPFYRLPLRFDADPLVREALQFAESEWRPHPQGFTGNSAIPLVSVAGGDNDGVRGSMLPTNSLERCPYVRQVIASFDTVIGRSRLMRVDGGERVAPHSDIHYYWRDRVRVHVPILTHPAVRFICDDGEIHMAPGEAWLLDTWRVHSVANDSPVQRIHLVVDTVGSTGFWNLTRGARGSLANGDEARSAPRFVPYRPGVEVRLQTERYNLPAVMSPTEIEALIAEAIDDAASDGNARHAEALAAFSEAARGAVRAWRAEWAVHGPQPGRVYGMLQRQLLSSVECLPEDLRVASNGVALASILRARIHSIVGDITDQPGGGESRLRHGVDALQGS